jgi:hypothetical protein
MRYVMSVRALNMPSFCTGAPKKRLTESGE